ncbi:hypothetical protein RFI_40149, partial [Reticulomyxa filosa]
HVNVVDIAISAYLIKKCSILFAILSYQSTVHFRCCYLVDLKFFNYIFVFVSVFATILLTTKIIENEQSIDKKEWQTKLSTFLLNKPKWQYQQHSHAFLLPLVNHLLLVDWKTPDDGLINGEVKKAKHITQDFKILKDNDIQIGYSMVKVEPFDRNKSRPKSHFRQCKNCYKLNHITCECPKKRKACKYCGLANHEGAECRNKNNPSKYNVWATSK